ncbi:hypothetical protein PTKIN_Ptkin15bG0051700 [Pterospermum kingtungense]
MNGNHKEQYGKIYEYLNELQLTNKGTTIIYKLDRWLFQRMYVCLYAIKQGFKAGCRRIVSFDGCFLKGYYGGHLPVGVGIDANDYIYPLAYATVESKNYDSWCRFIQLMQNAFEMTNSYQWTIMSDKQKGFVDAIIDLMSNAEHETCLRHLYTNYNDNVGFKGKELKDALWRCARATTIKDYKDAMTALKDISTVVYQ